MTVFITDRLQAYVRKVSDAQKTCTGVILDYTETTNALGNPSIEYVPRLSDINLWFQPVKTYEANLSGEVPEFDAKIRLSHDETITNLDRIRVKTIFGDMVNKYYKIIGDPKIMTDGLLLEVKLVTE